VILESEIDAAVTSQVESAAQGEGDAAEVTSADRQPLGLLDSFVLGALFLLPCAYFPVFNSWFWTFRMMILLVAIPPGAIAIGRLLRNKDRAAAFASAAVLWSTLGALTSGQVNASFQGFIGQDASVVSYAGAVSLWALSRFSSERARPMVIPVLVASLGLNLFVAFVQVTLRLDQGDLAMQGARAVGLTPNPVYFGALMAAGSGIAIWQAVNAPAGRRGGWCGAALLFGSGLSFSGSRVAAGALLVVGAVLVVRSSQRGRAAAGLSCALIGMLAGSVLARLLELDRDAVSRLSDAGSGGRLVYWRVSLDAIAERPLQGWGLGRFRAAVQGRLPLDELVQFGDAPTFWDAHNLFVGLAVAVGIPGLLLWCAFAWSAGRRVPPHLAPAVAAIAITWMLQPAGLTTLPLVVMLLGFVGSSNEPVDADAPGRVVRPWAKAVSVAAVTSGVLAATWLGVAAARLESAVQASDSGTALDAASMFGADPIATDLVAKIHEIEGYDSDAQRAELLGAFERTTEVEPGRALWWIELARRQGLLGDPVAALVSTRHALELEPFNHDAWMVTWAIARDLEDGILEREAVAILCEYDVEPACAELRTREPD
jgi:O-antigen ligase